MSASKSTSAVYEDKVWNNSRELIEYMEETDDPIAVRLNDNMIKIYAKLSLDPRADIRDDLLIYKMKYPLHRSTVVKLIEEYDKAHPTQAPAPMTRDVDYYSLPGTPSICEDDSNTSDPEYEYDSLPNSPPRNMPVDNRIYTLIRDFESEMTKAFGSIGMNVTTLSSMPTRPASSMSASSSHHAGCIPSDDSEDDVSDDIPYKTANPPILLSRAVRPGRQPSSMSASSSHHTGCIPSDDSEDDVSDDIPCNPIKPRRVLSKSARPASSSKPNKALVDVSDEVRIEEIRANAIIEQEKEKTKQEEAKVRQLELQLRLKENTMPYDDIPYMYMTC